jgi:hypothetical protein
VTSHRTPKEGAKQKTRSPASLVAGSRKIVVCAFSSSAYETRSTARHQSGDARKHDGRDAWFETLPEPYTGPNPSLSNWFEVTHEL